jgi:hypothetical protein
MGLVAVACAAGPVPAAPEASVPAGELRVRLVFGGEADLDLYVTDPALETIYFGNTPSSASGGALEADLRCDAPAPRVETVRFTRPPAGRYRVGVDHPERCGPGRGPVPFRVIVEGSGVRHERLDEIAPGRFLPAVIDFERR